MWKVAAVSVCGTSHEKAGRPCQDAHFYLPLPGGWLLAALADGAGSADAGALGAMLAVRAARDTFLHSEIVRDESDALELLLHSAIANARSALKRESETLAVPLRELATTLIVLLVSPERVVVAQIGDGAVVALDAEGDLSALTLPPDDGYINETTFLTSPEALDSAQIVIREADIISLAAFTDGLQRLALKLPEGEPHAPFFAPLFRFLLDVPEPVEAEAALRNLLRSPRIAERTDDDLTLLLATRIPTT